jgi:hypothetical protein
MMRKLYDQQQTKATVEEITGPGIRALRRVALLEVEIEQLKSALEARLAKLERPFNWKEQK